MKTTLYRDNEEAEWSRVEVRLSRRNLLTLLAKLDGHPPDSACTILGPSVYLATTVIAEEDDVHYNDRQRVEAVGDNRPGAMEPSTERALNGANPLAEMGYKLIHSDAGAAHYSKAVPDGDTLNAGLGPFT